MVCQCDLASDTETFFSRIIFIDEHIIVRFERTTSHKPETTAQLIKLRKVDPR
jgi:hypothetical protein